MPAVGCPSSIRRLLYWRFSKPPPAPAELLVRLGSPPASAAAGGTTAVARAGRDVPTLLAGRGRARPAVLLSRRGGGSGGRAHVGADAGAGRNGRDGRRVRTRGAARLQGHARALGRGCGSRARLQVEARALGRRRRRRGRRRWRRGIALGAPRRRANGRGCAGSTRLRLPTLATRERLLLAAVLRLDLLLVGLALRESLLERLAGLGLGPRGRLPLPLLDLGPLLGLARFLLGPDPRVLLLADTALLLLLLPANLGLALLLPLGEDLATTLRLGLGELVVEAAALGLVRLARFALLALAERRVVRQDALQARLDREAARVLLARLLGALDLRRLERLAVAGLLALVVLGDERDLLAAVRALEVVDALVDRRELLREVLLVLLDLLDLELDQIVRRELRKFLRGGGNLSV